MFFLDRVLNYVRKTARFKPRPAPQGAIHVRLAYQLAGVGRLDAPTILDSDAPGNSFVEHLPQHTPDEGMGLLRLRRRGGLAGADGPDRLISDDGLRHLVFAQSR